MMTLAFYLERNQLRRFRENVCHHAESMCTCSNVLLRGNKKTISDNVRLLGQFEEYSFSVPAPSNAFVLEQHKEMLLVSDVD